PLGWLGGWVVRWLKSNPLFNHLTTQPPNHLTTDAACDGMDCRRPVPYQTFDPADVEHDDEEDQTVKIILANPRGFRAGGNMAIESLERAFELFGTPIYVYHEIVHNRPVVERFRGRGVVFVDRIEDIPTGATVLYSAHGVAPAIRQAAV